MSRPAWFLTVAALLTLAVVGYWLGTATHT
jgi:hypothetical protein